MYYPSRSDEKRKKKGPTFGLICYPLFGCRSHLKIYNTIESFQNKALDYKIPQLGNHIVKSGQYNNFFCNMTDPNTWHLTKTGSFLKTEFFCLQPF